VTLESLDDWIAAVVLAAPSMPRKVAVCVGFLLQAGPSKVGVEPFLEIGDALAELGRDLQAYGHHQRANEFARVARLIRTALETPETVETGE
jgi:hypothetical protein